MFHWICPDCGQECSPAALDCPVCYPPKAGLSETAGVIEVCSQVAGDSVAAPLAPRELPVQPVRQSLAAPLLNLSEHIAAVPRSAPPLVPAPDKAEPRTIELPVPAQPSEASEPERPAVLSAQLEPAADAELPAPFLAVALASEEPEPQPIEVPADHGDLASTRQPALHLPPLQEHKPPQSESTSEVPAPFSRAAEPPVATALLYSPGAARTSAAALKSQQLVALGTGRRNLAAAALSRRPETPLWLKRLLTILFLVFTAIAVLLYVLPSDSGEPRTRLSSPNPVSTAPAPAAVHPLTKYVEVAGLRPSMDLNHNSILQYLVVNHAAVDLSEFSVHVTVRTAGGQTLWSFSAKIPTLNAYESRDLSTTIDTSIRSVAMPEWQNLKADVTVTTP
jgi:hypothetical protein